MASSRVTIVGGGFAGVECAHQLLRRGHAARLVEMRPVRTTDAHATDRLAEMVCSNSFRSDNPLNAVGLLKREMESVGSLVLEEARRAAVPAGDALAVDRTVFADGVTRRLLGEPLLTLERREVETLPDRGEGYVVVATGPLTSPALEKELRTLLGESSLYFYDAMAPIVEATSVDFETLYARRNDSESINRNLEDTLWLGRAHSIGHARQHLNLLGYALMVNGLALHRHARRHRPPLAA